VKRISILLRYLQYLIKSQTRHDIHSPFVYHLLDNIILDETPFYAYQKIDKIRKELQRDLRTLEITDLGAGSVVTGIQKTRKISDIATNAVKNKKYGQLLFRLVNYFKPAEILELGTSLGISTLYLALPNSGSKVYTIEGCPSTSAVAAENFKKAEVKNIISITGSFEDKLSETLAEIKSLDMVYFDGNHQYQPTVDYFNQCLSKINNNSIFIFDDIHWSEEMEKAWEEIKNHPSVTISADLFFFGIIFFRKEQPRQHFTIRY
jgi:predicted O-methyltransferase YrrM